MCRNVLIIDTSILNCWLQVPGKETCGSIDDKWDYQRIKKLFDQEGNKGSTFVLPVATLIETGNHIAQSEGDRFQLAQKLTQILDASIIEKEPWAAFEHQATLWEKDKLIKLSNEWPTLAAQGLGIGDTTIKDVAEYYAQTGSFVVQILTGDKGLKSYEPAAPPPIPRRRS